MEYVEYDDIEQEGSETLHQEERVVTTGWKSPRIWLAAAAMVLIVGTVAIVVALATSPELNSERQELREKNSVTTALDQNLKSIDDVGAPIVPGYTCGEVRPTPCSHIGGECTAYGPESVCTCKAGFRGPVCDWGPVPSTYGDGSWTQEKLKRIWLAYKASNAIYYTDPSTWVEADGGSSNDNTRSLAWYIQSYQSKQPEWTGKFYCNSQNGDSQGTFLKNCPVMATDYSVFNTYKFVDAALEDDTVIGVGRVNPTTSPSGNEELLITFGGTFSASSSTGKFYQLFSDIDVTMQNLTWNGVDLGYVQSGFYSSLAPILKPMLDEIRYACASTGTVTVTGHSLGAAEATIFAAVLTVDQPDLDIHLITFGTPRSGTPEYVKAIENTGINQLRIVNELDLITQVPTSIGAGQGILHSGPQVTLNFNNVSQGCKDWVITSQYMAALELPGTVWSGCPYEAIKDHSHYHTNLVAWLKQRGMSVTPPCNNYTF